MKSKGTKYLDKEFKGSGEVRGYHFERVKQTGLVAMYKVSYKKNVAHYEVFKRRINNQFSVETYPSAKQFGKIAFTTFSLKSAKEIFKRLQEEEEVRINK